MWPVELDGLSICENMGPYNLLSWKINVPIIEDFPRPGPGDPYVLSLHKGQVLCVHFELWSELLELKMSLIFNPPFSTILILSSLSEEFWR